MSDKNNTSKTCVCKTFDVELLGESTKRTVYCQYINIA